MKNADQIQQIIEIAKLYYEMNLSQKEISEKLNISRATVSRKLDEAIEKNIVTITVNDHFSESAKLEKQLTDLFDLKSVTVVNVLDQDYSSILRGLGEGTANLLADTVKDNDIIGISWGKTMFHVANNLKRDEFKNVKVVQLKGGVSQSLQKTYSYETMIGFSNAYQTEPILLNLPVIFESELVKDAVTSEQHTREVIDLGKKANIAIYTVGTVRDQALLFQLNYMTDEEIAQLKETAVGDICSRFFDKDGQIANEKLNNRTIGIQLDELRNKDRSILVAGGDHKLEAIHTAIKAGFCNEIVVDQYTAKALIDINQ